MGRYKEREGRPELIAPQNEHNHDHDDHDHDHPHDHDHDHPHDHDHDHDHKPGMLGWLQNAIPFLHGHSHGEANVDTALESSARGIWALKVSLIGLGLTAAFQVFVFIISGSVGLL